MTPNPKPNPNNGESGNGGDRRRAERFDTRLQVSIQSIADKSTMEGWTTDISSTGMRLEIPRPIPEGTQVRIAFVAASNNTFCEGCVIWAKPARNPAAFDCGVDVVRWGGDLPTNEFIRRAPNVRLKPDRRRPR